MSINYEESMKTVREVFIEFPKRWDFLLKELSRLDQDRSDIEHAIELIDMDLYSAWQMNQELKTTLRERRKVKDELHQLELLKEVYYGKDISNEALDKATCNVEQATKNRERRKYKMRQRTKWQKMIDTKKCMPLKIKTN